MDHVSLQEGDVAIKGIVVSSAEVKELVELSKYLIAKVKDMEVKIMERETAVYNKIVGLEGKILKLQENNTELLIENEII